MKLRVSLLCVSLAIGASPALAITVTGVPGTVSSVPGATTFADFDNPTNTAIGTFTGGIVNESGSTDPHGGGLFLSVYRSDATLTFTHPASYFGFLWGTPDVYNSVTVYDGAVSLGTFGFPDPADGDYVNFAADVGEQFTSVHFQSGGCCFEMDNFAAFAVSGVPEPATWAMMLIGFAGLGFAGCREARRRAVAA